MRSERNKEEEDEEQEEREVTLVADFIELVSNRSSRVSNCAGSCWVDVLRKKREEDSREREDRRGTRVSNFSNLRIILFKYSCMWLHKEPVRLASQSMADECAETSYYFQLDSKRVRFARREILFISICS